VLELAAPFQVSLAAISRHLKVLERAGLISRGRDAQWRPSQLRVEALREVTAWADNTRQAWESRFDRLTAYLHEMEAEEARNGAKPEDSKHSKSAKEEDTP
jgi:DNA-binding transcriptional ArsR family regulator